MFSAALRPSRGSFFGASCNAWDAVGAKWFGYRTFWVNRQGLPFEAIGDPPDHEGAVAGLRAQGGPDALAVADLMDAAREIRR